MNALLVYGGMPKSERQTAAHKFQEGDDHNLIIGVSNALGTGLTLTRAQFTILVEQQADPGLHEQMIGRMLRKSNYNWLGVLVFELYMSNYSSDEAMLAKRHGRSTFAKTLGDKDLENVLSAPSDGLDNEILEDTGEDTL